MEAYTGFAEVYDIFMDDIPYDRWCDDITGILASYGIKDGILCDVGCGTGQLTRRLADRGFDMIGIDSSEEMLRVAQAAEYMDHKGILYLCQDMRSFELYGTVKAVISTCNTVNYLLGDVDVKEFFRLANNYLDPGGLLLFDVHTDEYYKNIGESVIADDRGDASFIWFNTYDEESFINTYDMVFYVKDEDGDSYKRIEETHSQRAYDAETVIKLLGEAGLEFISAEDDGEGTIFFIAKERGKNV